MGITAILASAYMWYKKTPYFPFGMPEVRWLLVCRGLGGFFGVFGMYYSLLYLPIADATVITFLAPGLSCWLCSKLINEPFTRIEKLGTLVSFVGVVFIARPTSFFHISGDPPPVSGDADMVSPGNATASAPDASDYNNVSPEERIAAVGIALIGVLGSVCAYTTIRWVGKRAHPCKSMDPFLHRGCLLTIGSDQCQLFRRVVHHCQHRNAICTAWHWVSSARKRQRMVTALFLRVSSTLFAFTVGRYS